MKTIELYDTTLRDGMQQEGISFSVQDKLKIVAKLDDLGIHYIEGGWPSANPKDSEFFETMQRVKLAHSVLCAFGSTRHQNSQVESDPTIAALLEAKVFTVTLVGKSSELQVTRVLEAPLEENLRMISDSVRYLKSKGLSVFFDAEHFFDGYNVNDTYSLKTLEAAAEAGADCLVLCDTNGGALPHDIITAVKDVIKSTSTPVGIHAHNDAEMAVANTIAAVRAGATHVQGTLNGYGERCGNANLCSVIPNLQIKMGISCLAKEKVAKLTEVSHFASELANITPNLRQPYTGINAFTHKAGLHASGVTKWSDSYQHIDPDLVGNQSRILVSELSGASSVIHKVKELGLDAKLGRKEASNILDQIKFMESRGFQYEGAEASFELLVRRTQLNYQRPFELVDFMVLVENLRRSSVYEEEMLSEATVKIKVGSEVIHTAAEGNGPVNALDRAMRKALVASYPKIEQVELIDYKVRILEESAGTEAQVRVLIESSDGKEIWRTVGSSTNIIAASWLALADSLEYWLLRNY